MVDYALISGKGLDENIVRQISKDNEEPEWMLRLRLKALKHFFKTPMPSWGLSLDINFDELTYYVKPTERKAASWDELPVEIKKTFDALGIPEAERQLFAGTGAQFESQIIYAKLKQKFEDLGVIFTDMHTAVRDYSSIVKQYFGKLLPFTNNKFAALNTAVWSGGLFIYVPKNVVVDLPIHNYFRINMEGIGQFERTLIILEEGAKLNYIEGCTAPMYSKASLHAGLVEVFVKTNARFHYTTIQNWSRNIYNMSMKRALGLNNSVITWVDGNFGSKKLMKYPCIILKGDDSKADLLSASFAKNNQEFDIGAKVYHIGKNTKSRILSKSIVKQSLTNYRGLVSIAKGSVNSRASVVCDSLMLDNDSTSSTYPYIFNNEPSAISTHEARVGKVEEDQVFYLTSRGLTKKEALAMILLGFISPVTKELPLDFALELNKIIRLELSNA